MRYERLGGPQLSVTPNIVRTGARVSAVALALCIALELAVPAVAEFVPGRFYITAIPRAPDLGVVPTIFELDPVTGNSRPFVENYAAFDLLFRPDGSELLADSGSVPIVGFDSNGVQRTAYDFEPNLGYVGAMRYRENGDLYALNSVGSNVQMTVIPAAGGPSFIVADAADGLTFGNPQFAVAPDGTIYYANVESRNIIRITPGGVGGLFTTLPDNARSGPMAVDGAGNLFIETDRGMYRYLLGDPQHGEYFGPRLGTLQFNNLQFSQDFSRLYQCFAGVVVERSLADGSYEEVARLPSNEAFYRGNGFAVSVPEPCPTDGILLLLVVGRRLRRSVTQSFQ